ncbi:CNNM domain-containing protein [Desulfopila sp. IMCC35008]|uniref:CNNM domain-containing protein n=1 Tax=Desulfopila sp. IMCC35008 TaxID=2653858 RepID=UPI0013D1B4E0|nr:CNNM domain-containing protein [Desulfopila sp. IMCC35008]
MALLIFYVCLALGVSFLCSIMEAVLLSTSASYAVRLEQDRPRLGKRLKGYKSDIDKPLAAILSLNTIAHTVGAAGAGAQAAYVFGDAYIGVISAVLTFLILVFSEIIPKTLGAAYWRELNPLVIRLLRFTIISMWPLVKMAETLTRLMTKNKQDKQVHRDEFIALAELGNKEGIFHRYESRVLQNLFFLRDIRTRDIMTPRTVVFALPETKTVVECLGENERFYFSRIPVYGENLDDIKGFVLKSDIFRAGHEHPECTLKELCRPIIVFPGDLTLHAMFEKMMSESNHIALVVDNFGGTEGVVTMEDFIETLLGLEIVDEIDTAEDMQEIARKQWQKRAQRSGLIIDAVTPQPEAPEGENDSANRDDSE